MSLLETSSFSMVLVSRLKKVAKTLLILVNFGLKKLQL